MYQPDTTTITERELALENLELDRQHGAFDPHSWSEGDPIPELIEAFLEPDTPVDSDAVVRAWNHFSASYAACLNFPNALGAIWLTYSLETSPDGQVTARLKLDVSNGYSLTVSENSEYAVAVLPNGEGEEETVIPAAGHPLRALLERVAADPEFWTLEPLLNQPKEGMPGAAWELRLADPEEFSEAVAEEVQSSVSEIVTAFNPEEWSPGDPVPDHIADHLQPGASLEADVVTDAYWSWILQWADEAVTPAGQSPLAAEVFTGSHGEVVSVTLRLESPTRGRAVVSTDNPHVEVWVPRPDSRGLWPPATLEKIAHPLSGFLDLVVSALGAPELATVQVPARFHVVAEHLVNGQASVLPTSISGPGGSRRPGVPAMNRKARRQAQRASRRRNRKARK